jgi:hypothetical protein
MQDASTSIPKNHADVRPSRNPDNPTVKRLLNELETFEWFDGITAIAICDAIQKHPGGAHEIVQNAFMPYNFWQLKRYLRYLPHTKEFLMVIEDPIRRGQRLLVRVDRMNVVFAQREYIEQERGTEAYHMFRDMIRRFCGANYKLPVKRPSTEEWSNARRRLRITIHVEDLDNVLTFHRAQAGSSWQEHA